MPTLETALQFWSTTKEDEWTLVNQTWVHKDAEVSVPEENLLGGYIRSGRFFENAKISDEAKVSQNSKIFGNSRAYGYSQVYGNSKVYGCSQVYGKSRVYGNAWLNENSRVYGNSCIYGNSQVYGNSCVYGDVWVYGNSRVSGNILLSKRENVFTISNIGSRNSTLTIVKSDCGNIFMLTGCFYGTLDEFKEAVKKTHGNNQYAKEYLKFCEYIDFKFQK